jgi:hypothetical protein
VEERGIRQASKYDGISVVSRGATPTISNDGIVTSQFNVQSFVLITKCNGDESSSPYDGPARFPIDARYATTVWHANGWFSIAKHGNGQAVIYATNASNDAARNAQPAI